MTRPPLATALAGAVVLAAFTAPAAADVFVWTGAQNSFFNEPDNWKAPDPEASPGPDDECLILLPGVSSIEVKTFAGPYTVGSVVFDHGIYDLSISGPDGWQIGQTDSHLPGLIVGQTAGCHVTLPDDISPNNVGLGFSSIIVGELPTSHGDLMLRRWRPITVRGPIIVGRRGDATFEYAIYPFVPASPEPLRAASLICGDAATAGGDAFFDRVDVELDGALRLGVHGRGRAEFDQSTLSASGLTLGENEGATGTLHLQTSGAVIRDGLEVGRLGTGTIIAEMNSTIEIDGDAALGILPPDAPELSSFGTIQLHSSSTMSISGSLVLSAFGDSDVEVRDGSLLVVDEDVHSFAPERARIAIDARSAANYGQLDIGGDFVGIPLRIEVPADATFAAGESASLVRTLGSVLPGPIELIVDDASHQYFLTTDEQTIRLHATARSDLNLDGATDLNDLLILLGHWGPCPTPACPSDLDGDGQINFNDVLHLLGDWTN